MVELLKGSIFDSKCDLLIIPCNSYGGTTSFVRRELTFNQLPVFPGMISPGCVCFNDKIRGFTNASVIGYAASVDADTRYSSKEIVRSILKQIKDYCKNQSLDKINIPLLGTGAGKLSPEDSFEVMKEEFDEEQSCTLCVYVISSKSFEILNSQANIVHADDIAKSPQVSIKPPRVFISYARDDENNAKWVADLAVRLIQNGVNVRLDKYHLKFGYDLPQWMTNEIIMADKVLMIGDKFYAEKSDNRRGGVAWETMLIQGDMLSHPSKNKYVVIVRTEDVNEGLPIYTRSKYFLHWRESTPTDEEFKDLLLYLYDCDVTPSPGKIPDFIRELRMKQARKSSSEV